MPYKTHHHNRATPSHPSAIIEGFKQLALRPITGLILIIIIAFAITMATSFYVLQQNITTLSSKLDESAEISLYLKKEVNLKAASDLVEKLRSSPLIAKIMLIQPTEGMKHFAENATLNTLIANFKENPLPNVIIIQPKIELLENDITIEFIKTLKTCPEIETIKADSNWIERIHDLLTLWKDISTLFILLLSLNAVLIICCGSYIMTKIFTTDNTTKIILQYQFAWYGFISSIIAILLVRLATTYLQDHSILLQELEANHEFLIIFISSLLGLICSRAAYIKNSQHS